MFFAVFGTTCVCQQLLHLLKLNGKGNFSVPFPELSFVKPTLGLHC